MSEYDELVKAVKAAVVNCLEKKCEAALASVEVQPNLSTYPFKLLYQLTLSTHPLNPISQSTLSTHPLNPFSQISFPDVEQSRQASM